MKDVCFMSISGVSGYSQQIMQQLNSAGQNLPQVNNGQNIQQVNTGRLDRDGDNDGDKGISTDKESSAKLLPPGIGQNINIAG